MNTERAIKLLEPGIKIPDFPHTSEDVDEACKMAVAALRAQQTLTKLDRSRWEGCPYCKDARNDHVPYCRYCGMPQTEEAWEELERRINGGTVD